MSFRRTPFRRTRRQLCFQHLTVVRVMLSENVVDQAFLRDVIGSGDDKMLNVVAAHKLSGGAVGDAAEHFAHLLKRDHVRVTAIQLIKPVPCYNRLQTLKAMKLKRNG